jgi:glycolate oxidase iron-sulfur subunit
MQTRFTAEQLAADPELPRSESTLRKCVHCGFCTATCPTYLLLGDEADSPRGRIYMIQDMLERGGTPDPTTVKHVDRCLSCLACTSTCPSGVDYMHLIDHARAHIEARHRRPLPDRMFRRLVSAVLTRPWLFRLSSQLAARFRWTAKLVPGRLRGLIEAPPARLPRPGARPEHRPAAPGALRVGLMRGCVQPVLDPGIDEAAIRLLQRLGVQVIQPDAPGCCGALPHHLGQRERAHMLARRQIAMWCELADRHQLDALVITTSGCGTTLKDYGEMLRHDPEWSERAARVAALALDLSEVLERTGLKLPLHPEARGIRVAYQAACSLQHGQRIKAAPRRLLEAAGFEVVEPAEAHICCGSAGVYSLTQPDIARQLGTRKADRLDALDAQWVVSGNVGCMNQIRGMASTPVIHLAQILDWATGGPDLPPRPPAP